VNSYKRKVRTDYSGLVYCGNDECEEEMQAYYYPGEKRSWDSPGYGPDVDMPDECPKCGRKTTKRDRDAACEKLGEGSDERW
jgi:hypothetical protein